MGVPTDHANYDFGAADRLSWALSNAHERIESFARLRAAQRSDLLGGPKSDNWQGRRRDSFEKAFTAQQRALHELAEEMSRLKAAVDRATREAHQQNKAPSQHGAK
jgi:hypothetical protein